MRSGHLVPPISTVWTSSWSRWPNNRPSMPINAHHMGSALGNIPGSKLLAQFMAALGCVKCQVDQGGGCFRPRSPDCPT